MANPIKTIDIHTAKSRRSRFGTRKYEAVDENRTMSLSKSNYSNRDYVAGEGFKVQMNAQR
jgi:hypothetical protein